MEAGRRAELCEGEAGPWQDPMDPDGAALEGDARQRVEGGRDEGDRAGLRAREVGIGRWVRAMRRWREDEGDGDRAEGRLGLGSGVAAGPESPVGSAQVERKWPEAWLGSLSLLKEKIMELKKEKKERLGEEVGHTNNFPGLTKTSLIQEK